MHTPADSTAPVSQAAADIVFTSCTVADAAQAQSAGGQRRQVSVGGRRVKTIDVHAHCIIPEAMKLVGATRADSRGPNIDEVGPIRIGDLLVTSSVAGHAMKGDVATIKERPGCILGKALDNFDSEGSGKIRVLVSVR